MTPFFFDSEQLRALAEKNHEAFVTAEPFPHVIVDNFLPEEVADEAWKVFPKPGDISWIRLQHGGVSGKLASPTDVQLEPPLRLLLREFNTEAFTDFLEVLTGISGLIVDHHYEGGGLHQIERGGFLKVHADFNKHDVLHTDRRLNALLYFNKDWQPEWGGALELWDQDMTGARHSVEPIFNRLVVFETRSDSHHGHPDPLECPADVTRKSLAFYYYTAAATDGESHGTLYHTRPGEHFHRTRGQRIERFIPPVLADALKKRKSAMEV